MSDLQGVVIERVDRALADQWCSAAAVVVLHEGRTLARHGAGVLASTGPDPSGPSPTGVPLEATEPADVLTWFDLASVTKVFSAVTLLTLVERGALDLDASVAEHLPPFAEGERSRVTLRMLLSHTSGLPATWMGWFGRIGAPREDLLADLLATPLEAPPGTRWNYSCVGYNTAMALAETATGRRWAELLGSLVLEPMGLTEGVAFSPAGPVAATEYQPEFDRGVVQGVVHDEASWSLGGECANAGLFATADALAHFARAIRTGELPCDNAPLLANALPGILGRALADPAQMPWGHSLGLRIGQDWMGDSSALGHTGFTGTSVMIHPPLGLDVVVLANRVHPRRSEEQVHRLREEISRAAIEAVAR